MKGTPSDTSPSELYNNFSRYSFGIDLAIISPFLVFHFFLPSSIVFIIGRLSVCLPMLLEGQVGQGSGLAVNRVFQP